MVRHITQMAHLSCNHMQSMHITLVFSQNNDFSKNNITMYSGSQPEAKNNFPAVRWRTLRSAGNHGILCFPNRWKNNCPAVRRRTLRSAGSPCDPQVVPAARRQSRFSGFFSVSQTEKIKYPILTLESYLTTRNT